MIAAVIDIGSNTMRMSVYKIEGQKFTVLLSKKETGKDGTSRIICISLRVDLIPQLL